MSNFDLENPTPEEIYLLGKLKQVRNQLRIAVQSLEKIVTCSPSHAQEIANKTLNEIGVQNNDN
jgi:hypothetical protein